MTKPSRMKSLHEKSVYKTDKTIALKRLLYCSRIKLAGKHNKPISQTLIFLKKKKEKSRIIGIYNINSVFILI